MKFLKLSSLIFVCSVASGATSYIDFTSGTAGSVDGVSVVVSGSDHVEASTAGDSTFVSANTTLGTTDLGSAVFTFGAASLPLDSVNISGKSGGTITFSQAVTNPILHFYHLDTNTLTFDLDLGQMMALVSSNNGQDAGGTPIDIQFTQDMTDATIYTLRGAAMNNPDQLSDGTDPDVNIVVNPTTTLEELEAAGTIQFTGTFNSISFSSDGSKGGDTITRWAVGFDSIPEPTLGLLLILSGVTFLSRRRR